MATATGKGLPGRRRLREALRLHARRTRPSRVAALVVGVTAAIVALAFAAAPAAAQDDGDPRRGAQVYRNCAACHSLQEGVHLSGPSLAGLWGKKAGSAAGFARYTDSLKALDIVWDEGTLNTWLASPAGMAPGTTMTFRGIENDRVRADMVAFLKIAMGTDGFETVVARGLLSRQLALGQLPPSLAEAGPGERVSAMRHCGDGFFITTADGVETPYWETNVRLKVDVSDRGPQEGPVLLRSGMQGDRVSVVFSRLDEMARFIKEQC